MFRRLPNTDTRHPPLCDAVSESTQHTHTSNKVMKMLACGLYVRACVQPSDDMRCKKRVAQIISRATSPHPPPSPRLALRFMLHAAAWFGSTACTCVLFRRYFTLIANARKRTHYHHWTAAGHQQPGTSSQTPYASASNNT